jgi:hypothetical protein
LRSSSSGKHLGYGGADIAKKTKKTTTTKAKRRRRRSSLSERQILQTQLVFLHRSIVCEVLERLCGTGLSLEAEWQQEPTVWYSKGGFCAVEELQEMVVVVVAEEEEELRVIMAGM